MLIKQFIANPIWQKSFIFIYESQGYTFIEQHAINDDELADMDYFDAAAVEALEVGESCRTTATPGIFVRVS